MRHRAEGGILRRFFLLWCDILYFLFGRSILIILMPLLLVGEPTVAAAVFPRASGRGGGGDQY